MIFSSVVIFSSHCLCGPKKLSTMSFSIACYYHVLALLLINISHFTNLSFVSSFVIYVSRGQTDTDIYESIH